MNRRGFLAGLTGLLVAPSIVRAATLMPVSVPFERIRLESVYGGTFVSVEWLDSLALSLGDIVEIGSRRFVVSLVA